MRAAQLSAESSSREVIVYIGEIVHEQLHTVKGEDIESLPLWLRTPKVLRKKRVRDAIAEIVQLLDISSNWLGHLSNSPHVGQLLHQTQLFKKEIIEVLETLGPPEFYVATLSTAKNDRRGLHSGTRQPVCTQ